MGGQTEQSMARGAGRRRVAQRSLGLAALAWAMPAHALDTISIDNTAPAATKLAILLAVFLVILFTMRGLRLPHILRTFLIWGALFLALVALYAYRGPLEDAGRRVMSVLVPGMMYSDEGRVVVHRSFAGSFAVEGSVNGAPVRFLFDTGASLVVLSADDARRAGLEPSSLDFRLPVMTASGRTEVAPVRLSEMSVGGITRPGVRAAVARPGDLDTSLLGLTFLNRLEGYGVRQDRLVLYP